MRPSGSSFVLVLCLLCFGARAADDSVPANGEATVKHVDAKEADALVKSGKVVILDVRTPEEFKAGHIAGATNINFRASDFEQRLSGLDTNKSYLVHCASGGRSTQALPVFKKLHFSSVTHLDGGIKAWEKAGLPLDR
jgi:rhodanese-related sulfurtransferase